MFFRSLIAVLALGLSADAKAPMLGIALNGRVVDVYDGDTLTIDLTIRVKVRLLDCWAPEIRGGTIEQRDAGDASAQHLRELALNQPATLFVPVTGAHSLGSLFSFDRILGHVWVYDTHLGDAQIAAGHASSTKNGELGQ